MDSGLVRAGTYGLGLSMMIVSVGTSLFAGFAQPAPEIDAGSLSAGIGLVTAGVLILRSRRRSK